MSIHKTGPVWAGRTHADLRTKGPADENAPPGIGPGGAFDRMARGRLSSGSLDTESGCLDDGVRAGRRPDVLRAAETQDEAPDGREEDQADPETYAAAKRLREVKHHDDIDYPAYNRHEQPEQNPPPGPADDAQLHQHIVDWDDGSPARLPGFCEDLPETNNHQHQPQKPNDPCAGWYGAGSAARLREQRVQHVRILLSPWKKREVNGIDESAHKTPGRAGSLPVDIVARKQA